MDWDADGKLLLSVSADRNGQVWRRSKEGWMSTIVALRFKRAATCARWAPSSSNSLFAAGGSEGIVAIGQYEDSQDLLGCRHLRKALDGTPIQALGWSPAGDYLAVALLSGKIVLFGKDGDEIEDKAVSEMQVESWPHSLAFSKEGGTLVIACHSGQLVSWSLQTGSVNTVQVDGPLKQCLFFKEDELIAVPFSGPALKVNVLHDGQMTIKGQFAYDKAVNARSSAVSSVISKLQDASISNANNNPQSGKSGRLFMTAAKEHVAIATQGSNKISLVPSKEF